MGFGSYIGGLALGVLSILLVFFAIAVLLGLFQFIEASFAIPLGIALLLVALLLLLYGWYKYQSAKPRGTINVHNE